MLGDYSYFSSIGISSLLMPWKAHGRLEGKARTQIQQLCSPLMCSSLGIWVRKECLHFLEQFHIRNLTSDSQYNFFSYFKK